MNYASTAAVYHYVVARVKEVPLSFGDALTRLFSGIYPMKKNEDLADLLARVALIDDLFKQIYFSQKHHRISVMRAQNGEFLPGISPFSIITNDVSCEEQGYDLVLTIQGSGAESFASLHNARYWMDCGDTELFAESCEFEQVGSDYVVRIPYGALHPTLVAVTAYETLSEDDFV